MFELFGDPSRLHETGGPYEEVAHALIREFGIDQIVTSRAGRPSQTGALDHPEQSRAGSAAPAAEPVPVVSIVILTALGATHLRECLDSLRQQTYPSDRIELIVVDNGSANDPTGEIRARFPGAQVIRNETNIGFAAGNNQGAAAAAGDYVIFLNDDTRVDPRWVSELVGTARRRTAAAVASFILDWPGKTVDFVDGVVSFEGKGYQLQYGSPARRVAPEERPLLFACGCAMLVDRRILAEAGGWDEGAFAYYEDVELGWRLHLLGHQVWLAPRAVVYHKHHGTSERWAEPPRLRLYERNALRAMFSLLEQPSLERALPAALMLAADRALLESGLSRVADARQSAIQRLMRAGKGALIALGISKSTPVGQVLARIWKRGFITLGRDVLRRTMVVESRAGRESYLIERGSVRAALDTERQQIPVAAAAMLSGIYGFLVDIPQLVRRRADLQRRRQKSDRDVLGSLGNQWVRPSSARLEREHRATHTALVAEFQIADLNLRRTTTPETNPDVLAGRAAS